MAYLDQLNRVFQRFTKTLEPVLNRTQTGVVIFLVFAVLDLLYRVISHEFLLWPSSAVLNAWFDKSNELGYLYDAFSKTPAFILFKLFDYCDFFGINVFNIFIILDIASSALCKYFGLLVVYKIAKVPFYSKRYLLISLIIILSVGGSFSQLFHGLNLAGWSFPLNVGFSNSGLGCLFGFIFLNQELSSKNGLFWAFLSLLIHPIIGLITISFFWIYWLLEFKLYPKLNSIILCVVMGIFYKIILGTETILDFDIYLNNTIRHPHHYMPSFYMQNLRPEHIVLLLIHCVLLIRFPFLFALYIIYTLPHVMQYLVSEENLFPFLYQVQPSRFSAIAHLLVLAAVVRFLANSCSAESLKFLIMLSSAVYFIKAYKLEQSSIKNLGNHLEGRIVFVDKMVENLENLRSYCNCTVYYDNNYPFTVEESRIWFDRSSMDTGDLESKLDDPVTYITDSPKSLNDQWSENKMGNYYLYEKQ
jgi:hypothetical protein